MSKRGREPEEEVKEIDNEKKFKYFHATEPGEGYGTDSSYYPGSDEYDDDDDDD
jgi:hypothetical protein